MDFHRYWIYGLLALLVVGCVSCTFGQTKPDHDPATAPILAAKRAGCSPQTIEFDNGVPITITCYKPVDK